MDGADDRQMFADALERLFAREWSVEQGAAPSADTLSALWVKLCQAGVGDLGDAAEDVPLLVTAMIACGRAVAPAPLVGAALARRLFARDADLVGALTRGEAQVAVAFGALDGDRIAGRALGVDGVVEGLIGAVEDTGHATHFLILLGDGEAAGLVEAGPSVEVTPTPGHAVPALAQVRFRRSPARLVRLDPGAAREAADLARLLLTARAFGAQARAFDLVHEHVRLRRQFGRPIGAFQGLQHKLADCLVRSETARLMIEDAAQAFVDGEDVELAVAQLVAVTGPGLRQNALEAHHALGAIGYAEDHEAPRHFRRVHADMARMGGVRRARRLLGGRLRDDGAGVLGMREAEPITALRTEVRAWLAEHWGPMQQEAAKLRPSADREVDLDFIKALGERGWLSVNWPPEAGGAGFSAREQLAFMEEMRFANAPITLVSPSSWVVAPAIFAFGSQALRDQILPSVARGETTFCLGYSEPEAGSDLAALTTRADRDGDDYVINGQKIWTSLVEHASHVFLAARTDTEGKHGGVSVFVVPTDTPGITVRLMKTLHGKTFGSVFYDDVRVPAAMRVGPEGAGWKVLTSALASERVLMGGMVASLRRNFAGLVEVARAREDMAGDAAAWETLGGLAAELAAARVLALRSVALVEAGQDAAIEGAMTKLVSGELAERIGEVALDIFGVEAALGEEAEGALLGGDVNQHLRTAIMLVVGGGTPEIQRNQIAHKRLGLPR